MMSDEAVQKEIERMDQKIAELMKQGVLSAKEKEDIIDAFLKRIQALEDRLASASAPEEKKETRGRKKAAPKEDTKEEPKKEPKQIDYTEEDAPWWTKT
jgi:hypothetical protein